MGNFLCCPLKRQVTTKENCSDFDLFNNAYFKCSKQGQKILGKSTHGLHNDPSFAPERHVYHKTEQQEEKIWLSMKKSKIMSKLSNNMKISLINSMYLKLFEAGDIIYDVNEHFDSFLVVNSGEIEVIYSQYRIFLKSDESFGDNFFLNPQKSNFIIKAVLDTDIWIVHNSGILYNSRNGIEHIKSTRELLRQVPIFSQLTESEMNLVAHSVQEITYLDGDYIIHKGDTGTKFFIIKEGTAICYDWVDDQEDLINHKLLELRRLHKFDFFGEIALLSGVSRTTDIKSRGTTTCWVLRKEFLFSILDSFRDRLLREMKFRMLDKIPLLYLQSNQEKYQLVQEIEVETYDVGEYIIKQGDISLKFYMICEGIVECTVSDKHYNEIILRELRENDYFGEIGLCYDIHRSANIRAKTKVNLITINRLCFNKYFNHLHTLLYRKKIEECLNSYEFFNKLKLSMFYKCKLFDNSILKQYNDNCIVSQNNIDSFYIIEEGTVEIELQDNSRYKLSQGCYFGDKDLVNIKSIVSATAVGTVRCIKISKSDFLNIIQPRLYQFNDFILLSQIGIGGHSVVFRVIPKGRINTPYALKMIPKFNMTKNDITNIINERSILNELHHPFIIKCLNTFQDETYLYILQEFAEAGDLRTLLTSFPNHILNYDSILFYISSIVLALEHIHIRKIIHRDLKPENILLYENGYVKLCDFGSATYKNRCYTRVGTDDYMAPEVLLNKGHTLSCDYWSLGILLYEMSIGCTPLDKLKNEKQIIQMNGFALNLNILDLLNGNVKYPDGLKFEILGLLQKLLVPKPRERLGCSNHAYGMIREHTFFKDINFLDLEMMKIPSPIIPSISYMNGCQRQFEKYSLPKHAPSNLWVDDF